ncbi:MAG: FecR domain-containing protein [Dysgonamonadaceae bacterium]|jgi:ferric-dicitrate binding protein FerR (iron transport regulator)|nr:FecR domain-containing protein [Dysgonamonadaceae bacterium]
MKQIVEGRLQHLLNKHLQHTCSPEEETELALLISKSNDKRLKKSLFSEWEAYKSQDVLLEDKANEITSQILSGTEKTPVSRKIVQLGSGWIWKYSAAAAIILIVLFTVFKPGPSKIGQTTADRVAEPVIPASEEEVDYTRNIMLSDGSTVILHKGSTLTCANTFLQTSRDVYLTGEAYFDITHNPEKPFIIHSGEVNTVVLGTAFSIKAWPGQKHIVVAVTRGKVKVENGAEVLAVLVANQQLDYDTQQSQIRTTLTDANQNINEWIREDMQFEPVPLSQIVSVLGKRYGADIHIKDTSLGEKVIVSSFNGMESLYNVLDMLCVIMPEMHYEIGENKNITLYKIDKRQ